jgi:DNA-binding NarL/FixJ family response regulator
MQYREQPAWAYYAQVSVARPRSGNVDVPQSDVLSWQGSLPSPVSETDAAIGRASVVRPSPLPLDARRKCDNKQWGPWSLTQRELEVIQLLAEGTTNSEISERLFISPKTTKNHLAAIFQKLDVTNRTQALVRAVSMGLVSID